MKTLPWSQCPEDSGERGKVRKPEAKKKKKERKEKKKKNTDLHKHLFKGARDGLNGWDYRLWSNLCPKAFEEQHSNQPIVYEA
jgi:hypothetical protein